MDWSELTRTDWINLAVYGALGLFIASGLPRLFHGNVRAALGALLFWTVVLCGAVTAYAYRFELGHVTERVMAVLLPGTVLDSGPKEVTVFRQEDGAFGLNAVVNGTSIPFVLDTGASAIVIRAEDAARIRLPLKSLVYDVEVSTANGPTLAAEAEVPRLSIGALAQVHVKVLVARPGALRENLLGMSFLNRLEGFTVSNDRLVLRSK